MKAKPEPSISKTALPSVKHVLAPKITKVTQKEVNDVLEKFKISRENLPLMKILDPGLRGLDVEVGHMVKIMRHSVITGKEEAYYRVVVP
jgi:DNA-directed RNA polymerase subunit H (RpoH/RPB5)